MPVYLRSGEEMRVIAGNQRGFTGLLVRAVDGNGDVRLTLESKQGKRVTVPWELAEPLWPLPCPEDGLDAELFLCYADTRMGETS